MIQIDGIPGECVLSSTLRYDLAPIPISFEATIALNRHVKLIPQDGAQIVVNGLDYTIVKHGPQRGGQFIVGDSPAIALPIIAFPTNVLGLAQKRRSAVVRRGANLSEIYRACGASSNMTGDIAIGSFAALVGDTPTFMISRVLQEEGACVSWQKRGLRVDRLLDLAARTAEHNLAEGQLEAVQSSLLERDDIPVYCSCDAKGAVISGARRNPAQAVQFSPRKTARELNQMGRVLVQRGSMRIQPNLGTSAGQVVALGTKKYIVMTAAHVMQNASDGAGAMQYTRLWLGELTQ